MPGSLLGDFGTSWLFRAIPCKHGVQGGLQMVGMVCGEEGGCSTCCSPLAMQLLVRMAMPSLVGRLHVWMVAW